MKGKYLLLLLLLPVLAGCGGTRHIYFNRQIPSPFSIPYHIKSLAIIDRSIPEDERLNALESVLTGEGIRQDKLATQIVPDGLYQSLQNSTRFTVTRTTEKMNRSGSGSTFPEPLDWKSVSDLCNKYKADAYLAEGARMMEVNDWAGRKRVPIPHRMALKPSDG